MQKDLNRTVYWNENFNNYLKLALTLMIHIYDFRDIIKEEKNVNAYYNFVTSPAKQTKHPNIIISQKTQ